MVGDLEHFAFRCIPCQRQRTRQRNLRYGHLGTQECRAQSRGIELRIVCDEDIVTQESQQFTGCFGKSWGVFDIVRRDAVDGDIDVFKVLNACGRLAQPHFGFGFFTSDKPHGANLADRCPVTVCGLDIDGDKVQAWGRGGGKLTCCGAAGFFGDFSRAHIIDPLRAALGILIWSKGDCPFCILSICKADDNSARSGCGGLDGIDSVDICQGNLTAQFAR